MHAAIHKAHQQVHKHLKLQHHRHTGRRLEHKHTSYRGLAVVFVLAGMVMVGTAMAQRAAADTLFGVSATVRGPAPTTSAAITTPSADTILTSQDTLVAGNCPIMSTPLTIVLMVDNSLAGSAKCDGGNAFALPIRLGPGAHTMIAQTYTPTLSQGPDSQPIQVTYRPAVQTAVTTDLALAPTAPFAVLQADLATDWTGTVSGGTAPYHAIVDWGDGKRNTYTITTDSAHFTHRYGSLQSYNVRVAVSDSDGHSAQQQYASVAYTLPASSVATDTGANTTTVGVHTMAGLYGLYITVLAVSGIVWIEAKHAARHEAMAI